MNRVQKLEACKAAYDALQAQLHFVKLQRSIVPPAHDIDCVLSESMAAAESALVAARRAYRESASAAVVALAELDGREYDVLIRYYVLGCTTRTIAIQRGESHRTITRAKARGLEILAASKSNEEDGYE